jgi:hypothetical protein
VDGTAKPNRRAPKSDSTLFTRACYTGQVRLSSSRFILGTLTATLLLGGSAAAATATSTQTGKKLPSTTYVDKQNGYRITVPTKWKVVPPNEATVKRMAAQYKKQKQAKLAEAYLAFVSTANGKAELKSFVFRAFLWPALPSPVPTDVSVRWDKVSGNYKQKDLPAIAASFAKQFKTPGTTVQQPRLAKYPAGQAAVISGVAPLPKAYGNVKSAFTIVLFLRPGKLYTLAFRIDSRAAKDAFIFQSIAQNFRFVKPGPGAA